MRNSAVNKSNQNVLINQIPVSDNIVKEVHLKGQNFSNNYSISNNNNQKKFPSLFKKFRDSAQVKQPQDSLKQKTSKNLFFQQDQNSPSLKITKKQETSFELSPIDVQEYKENGKLQLNSKKLINFSKNIKHQARSFNSQKNKQINMDHVINTSNPKNNQSFIFGHGLQDIDIDSKGKFESTFPQKSAGLSSAQYNMKLLQPASQIYAPTFSDVSVNKKLLNRVNDEYMRSTGRNFFKRPLSWTASQDFLKNVAYQGQKGDKRQGANINLSISPFQDSQLRGTVQTKRQLSQVKSRKNLFNNVAQTFQDNKNRFNKEGPHLSLANSLNRLLFKYNGGHATTLYNYRLKIKNESSVRLSIKIKCTSPRSYEVRPSSETVLEPSEIFSVSIELKLFTHDLNQSTMKHDLSRYRADKFKIIYWTTDYGTQGDYFDGEKVLPVVIEETEEERARHIGFEQNSSNQKIRQATQEKEIQMYKKLIQKNKQKLQEVDSKISILNSNQFKQKYFSKNIFWLFGIFGFVLGFWLG